MISRRMRGSQKRARWNLTPSAATALSGSESKNAAMSFAMATRRPMSIRYRGPWLSDWRGLLCLASQLPRGRLRHFHDLHGGHLVFRAVSGPVGIFSGDEIRARLGKVERGVDHSRRHAIGNLHAQHGVARAAGDAHPVAMIDAARLGVVRMQ